MADTITITIKEPDKKLFLPKGESFFHLLRANGLFDMSHCGGIGKCGRCTVCFCSNAPLPTPAERKLLSPDQLRQGIRLACMTKPVKDCTIELCFVKPKETFILNEMIFDRNKLTQVSRDRQFIVTDLGTTTIAMLLVEAGSGKIIKTFQKVNPQRKYGSDVISRVQAGISGESKALAECVMEVLKEGIGDLGGKPEYMALAGNTCMIYLLLQYPLTRLARQPFTEGNHSEIVTEVAGLKTFIMQGISAFVGGDISAGIYAMLTCYSGTSLLLDLGTNGEMALVTSHDIYVTATAAGPAFEGRTNLWGRDMVKLLADLLDQHIIDEYGTLKEPYFTKGVQVGEANITQDDIRMIQLAKAAVRAGIEILCKQAGVAMEEIDNVCLAGGFGYYIDCERAGRIGLLPPFLVDKAKAVGNSALLGTFLRYRNYDIPVNTVERDDNSSMSQDNRFDTYQHNSSDRDKDDIMKRITNAKSFNLANIAEFQENYMNYLNLNS